MIRAFEAGDLPRLQELRRAAFAPVFESFRRLVGDRIYALALAESDREQSELLDKLARERPEQLLVFVDDGELAGFVSYTLDGEKKIGEIGLNAVDPTRAGRGIGTKMYEHVLAIMKAKGMVVATVGTGGDASHVPARRAYEKVGFEVFVPSVYMYKLL